MGGNIFSSPTPTNPFWKDWRRFNEERCRLLLPDEPASRIVSAVDSWLAVRKRKKGSPRGVGSSEPVNAKMMPPDTAWLLDMAQRQAYSSKRQPSCGIPPVCDEDLAFLLQLAEQRAAELMPELRDQVRAAVAFGQSQLADQLRAICLEGKPPLKGDDNKGDTPDSQIFASFGLLSPSGWAALDYNLCIMEIFCPRPSAKLSLLPASAALCINTGYDHVGMPDGCVGEARDYNAGMYAFLPYLPPEAPGPAGLDLLLDQTAITTWGRQSPKAGAYDAQVFMRARVLDGAVEGTNTLFTALGCSALPCDKMGVWNFDCPWARPVLESYMTSNDLVDFVSDCVNSEPMNLYRTPLLAGASLPEPFARWLNLGPSILDCRCGMAGDLHLDLFHTWIGAMTYNVITPRCRFARTLAWHARARRPSDDEAAVSFSDEFRDSARALLLASGASEKRAEIIISSSTPLAELAAECSLDLGRDLLLLLADCIENGPDDDTVAKRASAVYSNWRRLSWGPCGRGTDAYHKALKRDLILLACSSYVGGSYLALEAYVEGVEKRLQAQVHHGQSCNSFSHSEYQSF
ncbi:hypothetical protein CP533_1080 [Ophiocordyceps camponoti-saundersi (nom. inval.)]|nr:hypothetical protein CP533_1080 [Ophiocordyceps camponoti-saundersi (nom. inval.)]